MSYIVRIDEIDGIDIELKKVENDDMKKKLTETVSFAVDKKGEGSVIYMVDNPLFRGFWENGILLFSNALFLVN